MRDFVRAHMEFALAPVGTSFEAANGGVVPTGGLGWAPATFEAATMAEFHAALNGRNAVAVTKTDITPADARREARAAGFKIFGEDD